MRKINLKLKNKNLGMTYVELIVVLSIFSIMSSVILFNYRDFQAQVQLKSLSNEVALKIVEAQKSAMSGKLAPVQQQIYQGDLGIKDWRPAYGVFFNISDKKHFIYFADLDNSALNLIRNEVSFDGLSCGSNTECLDLLSMPNDYQITSLIVNCACDGNNGTGNGQGSCSSSSVQNNGGKSNTNSAVNINNVDNLSITFTRPDSGAYIQSRDIKCDVVSSAVVNFSSSKSANASVTVYPSGRIQIK